MPPPPPFQINSWRRAEENAATWMRWWGFTDAEVTESGSDGGVDVRSRAALVQVKTESTATGRPTLQRLAGARRPHSTQVLFFFSGAGFSRAAITYADEWDIACFTYDLIGTMTAKNGAAGRGLRTVEARKAAVERARRAAARRAAEERESAERKLREEQRAAEERTASRRRSAQRAADEREAAARRRRRDERAAGTKMAAGEPRGAPPTAPTSTAKSGQRAERFGTARTVAEPRPWVPPPSGGHSFAATRKPATARVKETPDLPQSHPSKRKHPTLWLWPLLICLATAVIALISTADSPRSIPTTVVFSLLAALCVLRYRAGVKHNRALKQPA
jgi:hypothetical protein